MEKFSVIIIAFNKIDLLRKSLISINNQSVIPSEVIITDDGSDENLVEGIEDLISQFNFQLKYVKQEHKGFRAAKARNNAIKIASYEKIIFFDQDIITTKNYTKIFIEKLEGKKFIVSYPIRLTENQSNLINENIIKEYDYLHVLTLKQQLKIKRQYIEDAYAYIMKKNNLVKRGPKLRAGVFAARKSDLLYVNGFDEVYENGGNEDDDLGLRLNAIGIIGENPFWNEYPIHLFHLPNYNSHKKNNQEYYRKRKVEIANGSFKCEFGLDNPKDEENIIKMQLK